jgi:hypothetical protein
MDIPATLAHLTLEEKVSLLSGTGLDYRWRCLLSADDCC